jgi:NAD(P)-dependent dehydrogenase (short-subunit alcohol dehydrogenase family)
LAAAGAAVVLTARSEDALAKVVDDIRRTGGSAHFVAADVADPDQIDPVIEETLDRFRRVDILVNNAGMLWPLEETADADLDEWAYNVQVNLVGPFFMVRTVLPLMQHQNYGRIVNVSSGAAARPIPGWGAYCASKAGLDMFTKVAALEVAKYNITVNALYPGLVDTEMQAAIRSVDTSESDLDFGYWQEAYEEERLTPPHEVARLIYWLVGPWSRGRNGEIFRAGDSEWLRQVNQDAPA